MSLNKQFVLKNLITICCIASIVLLLLPFGKISVEMNFLGASSSSGSSFSGFDVIFGENSVAIAWVMLICPIVLIAMNYIKQLEKYKSILAIILPLLSAIASVITMLTAGASSSASSVGASMDMKTSPQIGFFLLLVAYVGTLIAGAVTFYGLKFSKEGLAEFGSKLKEDGFSGLESIKELGQIAGEGVANISQKITSNTAAGDGSLTANGSTPKSVRKTNINQATDVLSIIAKLADMKEKGILTEDEFGEKKKELLSQI